jgi:GAF domain-containing protein
VIPNRAPLHPVPQGSVPAPRVSTDLPGRQALELVLALAATAGVAIENARLFDEGGRRQEWLQTSTEVTPQLLSGTDQDPSG